MPAPSSSRIDPVIGHLARFAEGAGADPPSVLAVLARSPIRGVGGESGTGSR